MQDKQSTQQRVRGNDAMMFQWTQEKKMDEYNSKFNKEKTQRRTKKELINTTTEIKKYITKNKTADYMIEKNENQ